MAVQCAPLDKHVTFNVLPEYIVYDSSCSVSQPETTSPVYSSTGDEGEYCQVTGVPWQMIIVIVLGIALVLYTALVNGGLATARRNFSLVMLILWTLLWAVLFWVLWSQCENSTAWWLLIFSSLVILTFFILVVALNLGG